MATSYTGLRVQDTYNAIIKIGDNSNLTGTPKLLSDGLGNDSPLYLSGTRLGIGISPAYQFHTSGNAKIGGNLIVSGNLTVNGTLTYLNVEDLAVEDPIIKLAKDNTANTLDIGLFGKYVATSTKYKGFFNDASDDKFKLFIGTTVEPTTTVDTSASGYTVGTLVANIEGNVTGNVTGGTISGTTGTFSGALSAGTTTITSDTGLIVYSSTSAVGANITFSDVVNRTQSGTISYLHQDTASYGSENAFVITGDQNTMTILADGKLMFKEGLYIKPATGTGAGTQIISSTGAISGTTGTFSGGLTATTGTFSGDVTANHYLADTHFRSTDTNATLSTTGVGTVYLRPEGYNIVTNQATLSGGTFTLNGVNPEIAFNGSSDTGVDMAIKATPEGLDFYEPEQSNRVHFQILDDTGVNAPYGYRLNGTMVIDASRNLTNIGTGNFSGQVTIPETPTADGHAASKKYVDDNTGTADVAKRIDVTVKNVSGGSLAKGVVVHAAPTATPPSGNVIEVIAADADDAAKMPAIGVLNETIADEAEGEAVMFGAVSGIDTSSFSIGDELYVSTTAGEFTATKPTANDELVQKVAIVIKSHATNGLIKVFGAGRANDVPNQIDRDVNFTDSSKLTFGDSTSPDYKIFHDGTDSFINNYTGDINIRNYADDKDIRFYSDDGSGGDVEYFRIDGSESRIIYGRSPQLADNVKLYFGNTIDDDASIKWDSTASMLFIDGAVKFLDGDVATANGDLDITKYTNTSGSATGTTLLSLTNKVGASATDLGDLSQQKTFIDFNLLDGNDNEYPQVRIGAEVGQNESADSQTTEGCGAFLVYTNNATGNGPGSPTGLSERLRIDYEGKATFTNDITTTGDINADGNIISETTSGNHGIKIITADDAEGYLIFGDADDNSMGGMAYNNATNTLDIDCNNGVALSFDSSRNATFVGTVNTGRNINLSSTDYPYIQGTHTSAADGEYVMRVFGYGDSNFYGSFDILRHDENDGEIRLRTKVNGTNTNVLTIVDGISTFAGSINVINGNSINLANGNINNVNAITFNDPGGSEGISWLSGNLWKIYESPNDLSNAAGNLQFVKDTTRSMTLDTSGNLYTLGGLDAGSVTSRNTLSVTGVSTFTSRVDMTGTSGWNSPSYFYAAYTHTTGMRMVGNESQIDLVSQDLGEHASSILLRGANQGFGLTNSITNNRLEIKYFVANDDGFSIHGSGTNVSTLTDVVFFNSDGSVDFKDDLDVTGTITGDLTGSVTGAASLNVLKAGDTMTGNLKLNDDVQLLVGTSNDFKIYHNSTSSNTNIENHTGSLYITNYSDDEDIVFRNDNGSGDVIEYFRVDGDVQRIVYGRSPQIVDNVKLYFGNDTTSDASIKWDSTADQLFIDGESKFLDDLYVVGNQTIGGTTIAADRILKIQTAAENNTELQLRESTDNYGFTLRYNGTANVFKVIRHDNSATGVDVITIPRNSNNVTFAGNIIKSGGTSSQFLMADGSVTTSSFNGGTVANDTTFNGVVKIVNDAGLTIHTTTNAAGAKITFSDLVSSYAQAGTLNFKHSDSASIGSGASFHFESTETQVSIVAGDSDTTGKFYSYGQADTAEVDFGWADDTDTGMYRPAANQLGLVAGGSRKLLVSSTGVQVQNGTLYVTSGGSAASPAIQVGDNDSGFYDAGANVIGVSTGGVLQATFGSPANSTPPLQIFGQGGTIGGNTIANSYLLVGSTTTGIGMDNNEIMNVGDHLYFGTGGANDIVFRTSGSTKQMRITSGGLVGIGSDDPDTKLHVIKNGSGEKVIAIFENSTNEDETKASIQLRNATNDVCSGKIISHRTGANFGADLAFELSDNVDGTFRERMRITETGSVGFSTVTPAALVDIRTPSVADGGTLGANILQLVGTSETTPTSGVATPTNGIIFKPAMPAGYGTDGYNTVLEQQSGGARVFYFRTSGAQHLSIDVEHGGVFGGYVATGAGTQSINSDAPLTIRTGNSFAGFDLHSTRTSGNIGGARWYSTSSSAIPEAQLLVETTGELNFYNGTNGAETRFTILSNGRVGIGEVAPADKLDVNGAILANNRVQISGVDDAGNVTGSEDSLRVTGYGIMGNRTGNIYITNGNSAAGASIVFGVRGVHNGNNRLVINDNDSTFYTNITANNHIIKASGTADNIVRSEYDSTKWAQFEANSSGGVVKGSGGGGFMIRSYGETSFNGGNIVLNGATGQNVLVKGGTMNFGIPGNGTNANGRFCTIEGSTDGSGEGSGRIFFAEHNSTTGAKNAYGMSLGYRGGATTLPSGVNGLLSQIGNGEWGMWGHNGSDNGDLIMYGPRSGDYVRIDGKLGIDKTPSYDLDVNGDAYFADKVSIANAQPQHMLDVYSASGSIFAGRFVYAGTTSTVGVLLLRLGGGSTAPSYVDFIYGSVQTGYITTNGSGTIYGTSSDYRLKENVVELTGALDKLDNLQPKRFNFISTPEQTVDGFLAHEVAEIVPEAIHGEKDAVDEDGNIKAQAIDQSKLVPLLVAAVQELRAEVELLKSQINS